MRRDKHTVYQKIWSETPEIWSVLAAAKEGEKESLLRTQCRIIWGPALFFFVSWVLRQAAASGKRRIYFLARDGYMMQRIASLMAQSWKLPVECRYLKGSRYALRIPQYAVNPDVCLDHMCRGGIEVTLRKVFMRVGFTEGEAGELGRLLDPGCPADQPLAYARLQRLRSELKEFAPLWEALRRKTEGAFDLARGYLAQEGLLGEEPYALVDSGWTGSIQASLAELLRHMGCPNRPEGYYFGLFEQPAGEAAGSFHSYYFSPSRGIRRKVYFNNNMFEAVCSSPEGMAVGYEKGTDGYRAVLGAPESCNRARIQESSGYISQTAEDLLGTGITLEEASGEKWKRILFRLFRQVMVCPSPQELALYGSYLFSDDVNELCVEPLAKEMTSREISQNHVLQKAVGMLRRDCYIPESPWLFGSIEKRGELRAWHRWNEIAYRYLMIARKQLRAKRTEKHRTGEV